MYGFLEIVGFVLLIGITLLVSSIFIELGSSTYQKYKDKKKI